MLEWKTKTRMHGNTNTVPHYEHKFKEEQTRDTSKTNAKPSGDELRNFEK